MAQGRSGAVAVITGASNILEAVFAQLPLVSYRSGARGRHQRPLEALAALKSRRPVA